MYSDLTIVCGAKRYQVHRALLATRSSFFKGACRNAFIEAETGVINLSEDDAEAVEHMVHCKRVQRKLWNSINTDHLYADFYHMDYLNKTPSRRSSQRSSRGASPMSQRPSKHNAPKRMNYFVEDPLLATMAAASTTPPLTPPVDEPTSQSLNMLKVPDSPMADQFSMDELEEEQSEPELDVQKSHLITHAKVYAIAAKYVCPRHFLPFLLSA